jgi:hypothetical protein
MHQVSQRVTHHEEPATPRHQPSRLTCDVRRCCGWWCCGHFWGGFRRRWRRGILRLGGQVLRLRRGLLRLRGGFWRCWCRGILWFAGRVLHWGGKFRRCCRGFWRDRCLHGRRRNVSGRYNRCFRRRFLSPLQRSMRSPCSRPAGFIQSDDGGGQVEDGQRLHNAKLHGERAC